MTAATSILVSHNAPSYVDNSLTLDSTRLPSWIGDFPPNDLGRTSIQPHPIWIYPHVNPWEVQPYTPPVDVERQVDVFRRLTESMSAKPQTKFRKKRAGDRIFLSLDIPGVRRGAVELTIEGYELSVKARRADTEEWVSEKMTLTQEYDVDTKRVDAWHEDGVLTVSFHAMKSGPVKIGVR